MFLILEWKPSKCLTSPWPLARGPSPARGGGAARKKPSAQKKATTGRIQGLGQAARSLDKYGEAPELEKAANEDGAAHAPHAATHASPHSTHGPHAPRAAHEGEALRKQANGAHGGATVQWL